MDCSMELNFGREAGGVSLRSSHVVKLEQYESATITCPDSHSVKAIPFDGEERTMKHNPTVLHGSNLTEGRYYCSHCPEAVIIATTKAPSVEIEQSCSTGAPRLHCKVVDRRFSGTDFDLRFTAKKPNGNWKPLKTGTNFVSINETELPDYADAVACSLRHFNIDGTDYRLYNFDSGYVHTIGPCETTPQSNTTAVSSPTPTHSPLVIAAMAMGISLLLFLAVILIIVLLVLSVKGIKRWRKPVMAVRPENPPSDSDKQAVSHSRIIQV